MADVAQCLNGPVRAGDRVKVVRPTSCCNHPGAIGFEFVVVAIRECVIECPGCGARQALPAVIEVSNGSMEHHGAHGSELIRIDPPALPESVENVHEVTA